MQKNYNAKRKLNRLKTSLLLLMMVCFALPAVAQVNTGDNYQVYMKEGNSTVAHDASSVYFYDDHGPSHPSDGNTNYWDRWYVTDKHYTYVFRPKQAGDKIKVTFKKFHAYTWNSSLPNNCEDIGEFSLRINEDVLKVYNSDGAVAENLIAELTGTVVDEFSLMADGPMTFEFISNEQFREEGWGAQVTAVSSMSVLPPIIRRETCSNDILLFSSVPNATLYYTTDGSTPYPEDANDPLAATKQYAGSIEWPEGNNITIKAVAVVDGTTSAASTKTFNYPGDYMPSMDNLYPTIEHVAGTNKVRITCPAVPSGMNETFYVAYTTDNTVPAYNNGDKVFFVIGSEYEYPTNLGITVHTSTYEFEVTEPNTTVRAKTFGYSCDNLVSPEGQSVTVESIYVDEPTIKFTTTNTTSGAGTCEFLDIMEGATVYYTTDGSDPATSSTALAYTGTAFAVTPGQTVRAFARIDETGYIASAVVSDTYIPTGSDGSSTGGGVYGTVAVLDDREPHTWSYYSDASSPVHSLNPADVKITYFGNGTGTVTTSTDANPGAGTWTQNATVVQVSNTETTNQFIYMKTLERMDGATADNPSGRCEYSTIPNPFSRRPTYGSSNSYRGFYGWRIKAIRGGKIYSAATGGTEYTAYTSGNLTNTQWLNSETNYYFAPDAETGMEVELEALWARAYVVNSNTTSGLSNSVGYERNFVYLQSNTTLMGNGLTYPVTYTTLDPATCSGTKRTITIGGTSGNGWNQTTYSYFTCSANTKFENANVSVYANSNYSYSYSNSTYICANNHDLIFGRGINGTIPFVIGLNGDLSDNANYRIRLESGTYRYVSWIKGFWYSSDYSTTGSLSISGTNNSIVGVLGCDYDRAGSANGNLTVTGNVFYGFSTSMDNQDVTKKSLDVTVKSGSFCTSIGTNMGTADAHESIYMGIAGASTNTGERKLTIEGGILANVAGGVDAEGCDGNRTFTLRMRNGTVNGAIYGAGAVSPAYGDRQFVITGGTVKGWIGGGCNGVSANSATGGQTMGYSQVYVGGNVSVGGSATINGSEGGTVFGAGKGSGNLTTEPESGRMAYGTNVVIADKATISNNVYGGGNYGFADEYTKLYVLGGTVQGSVFGGSNQNKGPVVDIFMKGGTIKGNLYGGSNTLGAIAGKATINVSGGTVNNVFGGGYGANTDMESGTIVTIHSGTINNNVYGGGALGTVSVGTQVNVRGGSMKDVFGAGMGGSTDALVSGNTKVDVTGGTMNNVYGGGENGNVEYAAGGSGSGGSGSTSSVTETFNETQAATYNASTSYIPDGWMRYRNNTDYAYLPRVSNSSQYSYISANDGNYLLMTTYRSSSYYVYAIMPKYENITEVSFKFAYESTSNGTLSVGYVTDNSGYSTFTSLGNTTASTSWTTYGLTEDQISTINNANGYIAFRFGGVSSTYYYSAAIDDVTVTTASDEPSNPDPEEIVVASKVTINGSGVTVNQNVFGGGKMGTTAGDVTTNLFKGNIKGHLYGGALGDKDAVYVGGVKTVNITGGHVFGNVYGGSQFANDANALTGYATNEQGSTIEINMSAGKIDQNLYGAGYLGHTYGSINVYVGAEAISSAPNHNAIDESINYTRDGGLNIEGYIYAGSDWGDFTGGNFGTPTVSGKSNVYVDGTGYNTTSNSTGVANYMKAGAAIFGCGTSCDAGNTGRTLIVRNYGTAVADAGNTANPFSTATRQLFSIQKFMDVIFDNAHLLFTGQGRVNSISVTEKYCLYEDLTVHLGNGSTIITNAPSSQIKSFQSVTCPDVYEDEPTFTAVAINGLGATGSATDNKIRVNGGSYIEIKYEGTDITKPYGELKGWAHMMSSVNSEEATCAYARPKQSQETGNKIPASEDNPNDGGFVSYDGIYNTYTAAGALVSTGNQDQIRYENHTPNMTKGDSQYFRIWRYGGNHSNIEAVLDAHATGSEGYRTVDVTVTLPPFRSGNHYYRFETTQDGLFLTTDYGSDILTYNAACYNTTLDNDGIHGTPVTNGYMYYGGNPESQQLEQTIGACPGKSDIDNNPNVNFGLVIMPNTDMVNGTNYIICDASQPYLAGLDKPFQCADNTQAPQMTFRLTYNNELSSNMTWDPMLVKLVQCDANGNITDYVTVELTVITSTSIEQDYHTDVYAIMDGRGSLKDTYTAKVILPTFDVNTIGTNSSFKVTSVSFTPDVVIGTANNSQVSYIPINSDGANFNVNNFGLAIDAADTYDNTNVWYSVGDRIDIAVSPENKEIGKNSGRNEVGIDVTLFYTSQPGVTIQNESHMGRVTINVEFDNYKDGDSNHKGTLRLIVDVYRIGQGENYYVDGVDGKDQTGYGGYPDKPAKTVNYVFNRCNYRPGGNIFVVNTVKVTKPETWNGTRFNSVNIYRYPGVHLRSDDTYGDPTTNPAFTGLLVDVENELVLKGIVMDGMYAEATATSHANTQNIYPSDHGCNFNGQSVAPMINVADGGHVNLKDGVVLQNNYNTTASVTETSNPGGALSVEYGGIARMNEDAQITANINALGGGVWVDGSLIVSDHIKIYGNMLNTGATSRQSNVWLTEATDEQTKANVHYKVIQIGTAATNDEYGPIENDVKIGVDKEDWGNTIDGFMPVVYAEDGTQLGTTEDYLEETYQANQADPGEGIIFHDQDKYKLEKYTDDHYLFWISTWIQAQNHQPTNSEEDGGVAWDGIGNITTANQFAWLISLINGENGCTADDFAGKTIVVNNDLDLKASIWVPIENFKGTLQGNGHVIQGLNSPLVKDNMGMFGNTDGATISDVIAKVDFSGNAENVGSLIGTMKNTTLSNVEAAGDLEGKSHTKNMGGLVGLVESGTIHSSFAVNDMTASSGTTVMGGLIGTNKSDLYNSFANTTMSGPANGYNKIGGLVGVNDGHVENCYAVVGDQTFPAFANTNNGVITVCYADNDNGYVTTTGEGTGVELSDHGTYDAVESDIKALGYLYGDNLIDASTNTYVSEEGEAGVVDYVENHIPVWNGLLSALNQWVRGHQGQGYATWNRPLTTAINGDLPILAFPKDNCVGNLTSEDGKMLRYSASDAIVVENNVASQANNGIDHLLGEVYNEKAANVYLYGSAINVTSATGSNKLFIHEDAALLQNSSETINATVGVTFDNSCGNNYATYTGAPLTYDWHFMSTSLKNAPINATYGATTGFMNPANITGMNANCYFPNGLFGQSAVTWDFYTYSEEFHHWVNLKRTDHFYQENGQPFTYENETSFVPGKGYMMAISQDSYMSSTGLLNNADVEVTLTNKESQHLDTEYNEGWNLVGNPYQGYLDLKALFAYATNANATQAYVYDADLGVYTPYVEAASENPAIIQQFVHPHQGMFVHSEAESTTLTFRPAMAKATDDAPYFRGDDRVNYPLVNLFAENVNGNRDLAVIEFNRPELGGATKVNGLRNANFQLSASLEGHRYGLVFTPEGTEKVPVHFTTEENGTFTLTWQTLHGDFTSLLLVDNMTGTITDMLRADHYTFDATTDDYASRFYITYRVTDVDEMNEGDGTFAYFDGSEWIIEGQGTLDVVDVLGRTLYSERLVNDKNRVSLDNVAPGAYLLRVSNGTNTMVQKIVVR